MSYNYARQKNICWTCFDFSDEMKKWIEDHWADCSTYTIYGQEVCPDTGRVHLQGYSELKGPMTVRNVQIKLFNRNCAHVEKRKGSAVEAAEYCKKEGKWVEFGKMLETSQGRRNDLREVKRVVTKHGLRGVLERDFNLQSIRVAEKFIEFGKTRRWDEKTDVTWIWGASGKGKTTLAIELLGENGTYIKNGSTKWWFGYENQENIVLDDLRDKFFPFVDLLNLCYRGPYYVEVKGGHRSFVGKRMVITTIRPPQEHYCHEGEEQEQLMRRIDKIIDIEEYMENAPTIPLPDLEAFQDCTQPTEIDSDSEDIPLNTSSELWNFLQ